MTWQGQEPIGNFKEWILACLSDLLIERVEPILATMKDIRIFANRKLWALRRDKPTRRLAG